jgi:hypothetical protein
MGSQFAGFGQGKLVNLDQSSALSAQGTLAVDFNVPGNFGNDTAFQAVFILK